MIQQSGAAAAVARPAGIGNGHAVPHRRLAERTVVERRVIPEHALTLAFDRAECSWVSYPPPGSYCRGDQSALGRRRLTESRELKFYDWEAECLRHEACVSPQPQTRRCLHQRSLPVA